MGIRNAVAGRLRRFFRGEKGNVAMLFALACLVIFPMAGFGINLSRVMVEKHKLQMATDAAALAAAHDPFMSAEERLLIIEAHLNHVEEDIGREIAYRFSQDEESRISLTTSINVNTSMAHLMGRDYLTVTTRSDAIQGGADIEVAMVLDITGSMAGGRITALREAAGDLVDIVIKEEQEPYYSKLAMVPYAVAVNVGDYADDVRGDIRPGVSITAASWQVGAQRNVTAITRANPAVVTSSGHGFRNGDRVWISGVSGMTAINNQVFMVAGATADTFKLPGVDSRRFAAYSGDGIIRRCLNTNCEVQVTAAGHGLANGDHVWITGVEGMTQVNRSTHETWVVADASADTYDLVGSVGPSYGAYTANGRSFCTVAGCECFRFSNASSGAQRLHQISRCATERTGVEAYTDIPAEDAPVGYGYLSTANRCPTNQIVPLSDDRETLHDAVDDLVIGGSTAGHLGVAWGFYTLSPDFGSIFPESSRPATFGRPKLHKFVVFMTDGAFNSSFCRGVLSRTSTAGSGSTADQINCNSENGNSYIQAAAYCTAIKDAGITIYTVGFEVGALAAARTALTNCASSPQNAYFASGSAELVAVFQQIGREINEVRLVR
jgi:Flp pilus assembly protein TadG